MRHLFITALVLVGAFYARAEQSDQDKITKINAPINIASEDSKKSFIAPHQSNLKSGSVLNSDFQVEFVNFPENAKPAFLYAVSIYENLISSPVPVKVRATWKGMGTNVLASCAPESMYRNFNGARLSNVYYPVALAEKLSQNNLNGTEADIDCSFNSSIDWYYGINGNCPSNEYDFVTIVLHELIHGLGFVGFYDIVDNKGTFDNSANAPSIYDVYIYNQLNEQIADEDIYTRPSTTLKEQLLSNNLVLKNQGNTEAVKVYAPQNWNVGTSIYHYNESGFDAGDANALMSPFIFKGEAIHYPGDKTIDVLAQLGWKAVSFDGYEIKDFEEPCEKHPVFVEVGGEMDIDQSSVKITFSTDNFATSQTVNLAYNNSTEQFEGDLPLNNAKGKIQYYYHAKTTSNVAFSYPERAPEQKLSFRVGADYYPPLLQHNPEKMVNADSPVLNFAAVATDNVGIARVEVEYRINGQEQEAFILTKEGISNYAGKLEFSAQLYNDDVVEYRILAIDNTSRENKRRLPATGYYNVSVFETEEPMTGYFNNFDSPNTDFEISDFEVTLPAGFTSGNLHTVNPYPESNSDNQKYNLLAQLKYPIVLEENGLMSFDEVVLVEPGEEGTVYTEDQFWDFVIVEASKNNGKSWLPVTDGYDSSVDDLWSSQFTGSLKSAVSQAAGAENMFLKQTINLTDNTGFEAGDTVIFRFRLASDKATTGWGWAIDNLSIQNVTTAVDEALAADNVTIYPNPFKSSIYIDGFQSDLTNDVEVIITDLYGKTVHRETLYDASYSGKIKIDLPNVAPGVYMASVSDNNLNTITQKIIKN
ncbi:T9SS type A sorting domain-containing protein [Draconibacterium halophilum]|uniref:T9SS type A sorting domain-containing protein n=1 Tax=Draconibacterium halophilum TaxID=2706887 RepID=A0A6C0RJN3_9BACT|nr:T9SS type A sorting domain-containing protein [Draconibacterium halophilum]QIA09855.1 T9SS type A sorting domain-containing protein [Draconibacterium halophilum]